MTTSILAQKLMTVKLDKSEFEKVKWLKQNTTDEKHRATEVLQQLLLKQGLHKTCRLCLRPGGKKIFNTRDNVDKDVKYVLGIEVSEGDGKPQHICNICLDMLRKAAKFKQTAETTQWRLQQELEMVLASASELDEPEPKKRHGGHFNTRGPEVAREWSCRKCSKMFHSQEEFTEHERLPSCRRRLSKCYVCESCGREFKTLTLLKRHRLVHSSEPGDYECPHCSYRCRTKYALQVHVRWHTGDRPLRCTTCSRTFSNAGNLWTHKQTHLPPKYHCDKCPKSFKYKELLADHIASVHCTEKPFYCKSCGKTFAIRKKLLRHERNVHNRPRKRVLGSYRAPLNIRTDNLTMKHMDVPSLGSKNEFET